MSEPTIEIAGPDAEDAARELQELLRAELGEGGRRVGAGTPPEEGTKVDPALVVGVVSAVLALPGFVLATVDLTKRMELGQKARRIIDWARGRRTKGLRFVVVPRKGASFDLDRAEPGDLVDVFLVEHDETKASRKP